jgi:hypothetical protein
MFAWILAETAQIGDWSTALPVRLGWRIVTLVVALASLCAAGNARADQLHVSTPVFSRGSGTVVVTVIATGPPDTAIDVRLYRNPCPQNDPPGEGVEPGMLADGQPYEVPALPDEAGVSGDLYLCVWTIHEDGVIGARYQQLVRLPKPPPPGWNPVVGTNHPWWWAVLGWSALLTFIALLIGIGLIRRSRRRRRRSRDPFGNPPQTAAPSLNERLRVVAEEAGGAAHGEADTLEFDAVGHRADGAAQRPAGAAGAVAGAHPFVRPPARTGEQPIAAERLEDADESPDGEDE